MTASIADTAGIIQGIGSLTAIGAAVWIYAKQYRDKRADDEDETRAFAQAVRDEVGAVWLSYNEAVGPSLRAVKEGDAFNRLIPDLASSLIIYPNASARLGKIDDSALRKLIVTAYTGLLGHFSSMDVNNRLVMDLDQLERTYWQADRELMRKKTYDALYAYAQGLKQSDGELKDKVTAMLVGIDAWLATHPTR
jgi:hypothetical protein